MSTDREELAKPTLRHVGYKTTPFRDGRRYPISLEKKQALERFNSDWFEVDVSRGTRYLGRAGTWRWQCWTTTGHAVFIQTEGDTGQILRAVIADKPDPELPKVMR